MVGYYDEIEIEDMTWDEEAKVYHYPCPCGDRFEISRAQLAGCEDIAICPSCSLVIRVIYDPLDYEDYEEDEAEASSTEKSEPRVTNDVEAQHSTESTDPPAVTDLSDAVANIKFTDSETPSEQNVPVHIVGEPIRDRSEGSVGVGTASVILPASAH